MNCAEANQLDLVGYLSTSSHQPRKIKGSDHWYLCPSSDESEASFQVNRRINIWYDQVLMKDDKTIDSVTQDSCCEFSKALQNFFFTSEMVKEKHTAGSVLQHQKWCFK